MISRAVAITAITVVVLAAMYAGFKAAARGGARPPQSKTYHLGLVDQRLVSGSARIEASEGDSITLAVTSNRAGTLHVHEYEQHLVIELVPGRETSSRFTADRAGRFGVHLISPEGLHAEIAAVEVQPR